MSWLIPNIFCIFASSIDGARAALISSKTTRASSTTTVIKLPQLPNIRVEMVKIRDEVKMKSWEPVTRKEWGELVISLGPPSAAFPIDMAGAKFTFSIPGVDLSLNNPCTVWTSDVESPFNKTSAPLEGSRSSLSKQTTSCLTPFNLDARSIGIPFPQQTIPNLNAVQYSVLPNAFADLLFATSGLVPRPNQPAGKGIGHRRMWELTREPGSRIGSKSGKGIPRFRRRNNLASTTNAAAKAPKPPPACFSSLPIELRLLIFEAARPDPRVVKLSLSKHHKSGSWPRRIYSGAAIPNLLHLCGESRQVALEWYTASFGPDYDFLRANRMYDWSGWEHKVYFDWGRDELYVQCDNCRGSGCYSRHPEGCGLYFVEAEQRTRIKRLVFEFSGCETVIRHPFIWFPKVEHFKCVHWEKGLLYRHEAPLADFEEDNEKYSWQEGKYLQDSLNHERDTRQFNEAHTVSRRLVKTFSQVALQPLNTLQYILKDAEIRFNRKRDI
ncbi:hypothetical protein ACEPPN_018067 [Leptodophora sp. 'Broadleaf-Isolate-01']